VPPARCDAKADEVDYLSLAQDHENVDAPSLRHRASDRLCSCDTRSSPEDFLTVPCDVIRIDKSSPRLR
jgi:hypothetical protein